MPTILDNCASVEKLLKARMRLLDDSPFFAQVALRLVHKEDTDSTKTAWTDGISFGYNPAFIDTLTPSYARTLYAHEVLHIVFLHHTREDGRDHEIWNDACDYRINLTLVETGFEMIPGGLISNRFRGMNEEKIYDILYTERQDNPQGKPGQEGQQGQDKSDSNFGEVRPHPTGEDNKAEVEREVSTIIQQAAAGARKAGKLPACIEKLIEEMMEPTIPWQVHLKDWMNEQCKSNYTWKKPNKAYIQRGIYLPSLNNIEMGTLVVILDVSGSIYSIKSLLEQFIAEIEEISRAYRCNIIVIQVNTRVTQVDEFEAGDELNIKIKGGGGTRFRPGFHYLLDNDVEHIGVIYFTDGGADDHPYPSEVEQPLLWVVYNNPSKSFKPQVGEVVFIQN
jgi:predicted metal-dependent peptidase